MSRRRAARPTRSRGRFQEAHHEQRPAPRPFRPGALPVTGRVPAPARRSLLYAAAAGIAAAFTP
ncbi:hypothetical protein LCE32_01150, partial [Streptomyces sp. 7G]|uniref:hypothetical protein n=1 Tax=Streptomyces sp. 7G TaxID=2877241 RepID=UPI001CD7FAB6